MISARRPGWFRLIALAEAVSWVGLLVGMYFKYLGSTRTEIGVKVFGMAHGLIFIAFVVAALLVGIAVKWTAGTWLLALLASIVPLCSVIFLIWADRTGRMGAASVSAGVRNQADRYPKRRDRLGGVTRPRPPVGPGPSIAGAVDLSGLKQRATPPGDGGAPGRPPARPRCGDHRGQFRSRGDARSNQVPVVVVLWSPRSDASVQLGDALASLAADDAGKWSLVNVNVDTTPRVAQIFGVQAVPTVVALAGGQPLSSFQGPQPPDQLRGWIDSLLNATAGKLGGGSRGRRARAGRPRIGAGACVSGRR